MQTTRKVITSFTISNYPDSDLYVFSQIVLTKLTGNATFPAIDALPPLTQPPAPAPPTPNLTDASSGFFTALQKARKGSVADTVAKDSARKTLTDMLSKWANYVNLIAKGEMAQLITSGFDINKERQKIGILEKPATPTVSSPGVGQIKATGSPVDGAGAYKYEFQRLDLTNDQPVGLPIYYDKTSTEIFRAGLVPGSRWAIRYVAVGSDDSAENWSDAAKVTVLQA